MTAEIRLNGAGRRRLEQTRHPWVFRDHVAAGEAVSGALVRVTGPDGAPLGVAAWSARSKIALRFLSIGGIGADVPMPGPADLRASFLAALARRAPLAEVTDAVRLVSSEADGFPGLIVDRYADVCVVSALTPFADLALPEVVEWLREALAPRAILARNDGAVRELEGLPRLVATLHGEVPPTVEVREGEVRYLVPLLEGQKTGLFLDQRANRLALGRRVFAMAQGAAAPPRVLDVFSYAGGFALHAAAAGAAVTAVDESARAVAAIRANAAHNDGSRGFGGSGGIEAVEANAFRWLRAQAKDGARFDAVVLDPPAFAKNRREVEDALRGYREINVRGFSLVAPGGLLVTASCSYHVDEATFEQVVRQAAADAGRDAVLIERGAQDQDHPILLSLPESRYLKCLVLRVR